MTRFWKSARLLAAVCFGEPAALWILVGWYVGSWIPIAVGLGILGAGAYLIHLMPKEAAW